LADAYTKHHESIVSFKDYINKKIMEGRLESDKLDEYIEKNTQIDEKISIEEGYVSDKDESGMAESDTEFSGHRLKLKNEE
jgi:hypothetical protein